MQLINLKSYPKYLFYLFVFSFLLRSMGVLYGLPLHINIDEPALISTALTLRHNINPGHFDWPHLYFYATGVFYFIAGLLRVILSSFVSLPYLINSESFFFIVSRLMSAFIGGLMIFPVYKISKTAFGKKTAVISVLIVSILPVWVYESHFAKIDVPLALFSAFSIYYLYKLTHSPSKSNYIKAGLLIGLSASIKYTGVLLILMLLWVHLFQGNKLKDLRSRLKGIILAGIFFVLGFFAGTPFALLDYKAFLSNERGVGALWQFTNLGKVSWPEYPVSLYNTFVTMFKADLGVLLWVVFSILLIHFLFFNKRDKKYVFFIVPFLFYSFYVSSFQRSTSHYFLFLIPLYLPVLSDYIMQIAGYLREKSRIKILNPLSFTAVFATLVIIPSVYLSFYSVMMHVKSDTRLTAYKWLETNVKDDDFLYVYGLELKDIELKKDNIEWVTELDRDKIELNPPFYVIVGQPDVPPSDILSGDRKSLYYEGAPRRLFEYAELGLYAPNTNRLGPPIYIFYVDRIDQ